jgi:hypothetical protein
LNIESELSEFKDFIDANVDWQMIAYFIGTDVQSWWDVFQAIVGRFSAGVLSEDVILADFVVVTSFVHPDHDVVDAHEESEEDVEA